MCIPLSRPPGDGETKQAVPVANDSRQYVLGPVCQTLGHAAGGPGASQDLRVDARCRRLLDQRGQRGTSA